MQHHEIEFFGKKKAKEVRNHYYSIPNYLHGTWKLHLLSYEDQKKIRSKFGDQALSQIEVNDDGKSGRLRLYNDQEQIFKWELINGKVVTEKIAAYDLLVKA